MSDHKPIDLTLKVWRQAGPQERGRFETIPAVGVDPNMSFMEMLDALNEKLILADKEPIEFDNDCREGICGTCGAMVNGIPHGHGRGMTICQLHMRAFEDGDTHGAKIAGRKRVHEGLHVLTILGLMALDGHRAVPFISA